MSDLKNYATAMTIDPETGKPMSKVTLSGSNAEGAVAVTPDDANDLTNGVTKGLYVGGSGDIKVDMADGSTAIFTGISAGMIHPLSVKRVHSTGTTATFILAVY